MFGDTIAAISTAWGEGGIAIVRVSGPDAWQTALKQVRLKSDTPLEPRRVRNALLLDEAGEVIDDILIVPFQAPHSYTGEDVAELQCHGGTLAAQRCLELLIKSGARMALPGEFTRRAFENGRLDLSQAEAVGAIIQARSNEALRAANRTLKGELTHAVTDVYEELTELGAEIEVGLDFPEEDVPYLEDESVLGRLEVIRQSLGDLLERCSSGVVLREGIRVAIVGRPNAGKSSLLNALLKESRAIVTSIPGTTRDIIEAVLTYRGVPLRLVDTAGITDASHDEVEAIGIERARAAMRDADVRIWVIDGSQGLGQEELDMIHDIETTPHVVALSKADLPKKISEASLNALLTESPVISVSSKKGLHLEELKETIVGLVSGTGALDSGLNASARQVDEIRQTIASVDAGIKALRDGLDQALAASCVADARKALTRLLGGDRDEDLLHAVFSRFCVGK
ncbi:MAG: tRNA uridine-5-carboxymethylaminomethyl(34) synthesis GTPase MnmE [Pyramidobacter sp.]|nr:tRNA uridine-5-carboxymethylaminomethyl(34) synthesis GTPase MnmE [Pyramidobacter sp.]